MSVNYLTQTTIRLPMPDADVTYYPHFFTDRESDLFFQELLDTIDWQHEKIRLFNKEILQPRLTAWYGDIGKAYTYSGITMQPHLWTPTLLTIKEKIETFTNANFNSVLLNLYRDGKDSVAWHSDDEPELRTNPIIASVSLGSERVFQLRHKLNKNLARISFPLAKGSLLIMQGTTQHYWQHQIPKTAKAVQPRINLTFRVVTYPSI
ncbi:MAG: alpha-ketoglutarate-dependent dioxygenase AlkB [Acidobacteriota bacterium]